MYMVLQIAIKSVCTYLAEQLEAHNLSLDLMSGSRHCSEMI